MTPPVGRALTEEELEVARILSQLPKLVYAANPRRLPDFLRWGARRRRSALDDRDPLLPPPPPSDGNDERKDGHTSSPTTPLSFPPSGGEEPDARPPRPPRSSPSKAVKNTKRHKEWVKEQSQLIASLSDRNSVLQRSIAEHSAVYEELKAKNSWLRDLQSKVLRGVTEEVGQRQSQSQSQRRDGSSGLAPPAPTSIQPPATLAMVDPHHHATRWEMGRAVPPPPPSAVDAAAGAITPAAEWREWGAERRASLDLNARPEEEEEGEEWEQLLQSSAYKAAMSAQARKRRLEIQREKNSFHSSSSSSLFSRAHKMQRLR